MPITRPNVNLYSINNLALDYDPGRGRYGLSLECPRADAFTLCLGKKSSAGRSGEAGPDRGGASAPA